MTLCFYPSVGSAGGLGLLWGFLGSSASPLALVYLGVGWEDGRSLPQALSDGLCPHHLFSLSSDNNSAMSESQVQKMNAELAALKQELQALKEAEPVPDNCNC